MEAAYQRFDDKTTNEKIRWVLEFAKPDRLSGVPREDRVTLGYDLRALARIVGLMWVWRFEPGPLSYRDLIKIHSDISVGLRAVRMSAAANLDERVGWQLPPHRIRARRLPAPADASNAPTSIIPVYEAANERSAIVAAIGEFLLRDSVRWRFCECGCGESFPVNGKKKYFDKQHENRTNQKKCYRKAKGQGAAGEEQ